MEPMNKYMNHEGYIEGVLSVINCYCASFSIVFAVLNKSNVIIGIFKELKKINVNYGFLSELYLLGETRV